MMSASRATHGGHFDEVQTEGQGEARGQHSALGHEEAVPTALAAIANADTLC
jgi:hypothetical protein